MILCINLGKDNFTLKFDVLKTPLADQWLERMSVRDQYPLDHPTRFYGFGSQEEEEIRALALIRQSCQTINNFQCIIEKAIDSVYDQDTLNYLHNIFERYHGLLDQQNSEFWYSAPDEVKRALADLNINVHRCESVARGNRPRLVCTWYGLPKTKTLTTEVMQEYGELEPIFGTVCLNYCEIGKRLEDLTEDNDEYISNDAFKPFNFYSADFVINFFDNNVDKTLESMLQYYREHQEFFVDRGFTKFEDPRLLPLRFPVARLIETMSRDRLLTEISKRQYVSKVYFDNS